MPIEFDPFDMEHPANHSFANEQGAARQMSLRSPGQKGRVASGGDDAGSGKWAQVFSAHTEGGGPFGGRNNALVAFVGFLRAKSFPFEAGRLFALKWNQDYCSPSLPDDEVLNIVSRAWAEWAEGGQTDETPNASESSDDWPILTLAEMEEAEKAEGELTWILPNGIPAGGLIYISAPPAGGKTWVLLDLVRCFISGGQWVGKFDIPETPVLYIDEEMGVRKILPRLRKLGVKGGDNFWYTNRAGVRIDKGVDVNRILTHCKQHKIQVVIIDTLTRVHRLDENDNSQMRQLFAYVQTLLKADIAVIIAHHDRKGGQGESHVSHERMRGAGEIAAAADMTYSVDKRGSFYHLECTKGRLASDEDQISVDFVIEDSEDRTQTILRPIEPGERSAKTIESISDRVLSVLRTSGPLDVTAINDNVKGSPNAIGAALAQLAEAGKVEIRKNGRSKIYSFVSEETEGSGEEE